jgi:hypothetical protein
MRFVATVLVALMFAGAVRALHPPIEQPPPSSSTPGGPVPGGPTPGGPVPSGPTTTPVTIVSTPTAESAPEPSGATLALCGAGAFACRWLRRKS